MSTEQKQAEELDGQAQQPVFLVMFAKLTGWSFLISDIPPKKLT